MQPHIQIKLFANLQKFMPASAENYAIEADITVGTLIQQLDIPQDMIKLVFIGNVWAELASILKGGERVGVFPAVGGGWEGLIDHLSGDRFFAIAEIYRRSLCET